MAIARDAAREAAQGRPFRCETPYFIADGSERFVELVVNPVKDDAGRVKFLAPAGADITDLKRTERALRRLAAELAEVDRRKTEFLATLAHELRNPLTPIRHALTLLANPRNAPATIESLRQMMERQVANLVRLVDDLLDLARINSGKINLLRERVELAAIVADAMEISRPHIEAAWHAFVLDLPEPPVWLDVDRTRIAQVLSNLLNNAAKYTPVNGRIGLSARRDGDEIVISVTDNGIGIAPESLDTLFQMFAQVADVHDERGGLGVGLSLVRSVVELHGGTVRATSPGLGKGSTFTVRLPVQDAPASRGSTLNRAEPADT
jgi:signal transduction histidine kinase